MSFNQSSQQKQSTFSLEFLSQKKALLGDKIYSPILFFNIYLFDYIFTYLIDISRGTLLPRNTAKIIVNKRAPIHDKILLITTFRK